MAVEYRERFNNTSFEKLSTPEVENRLTDKMTKVQHVSINHHFAGEVL